MKNLIWLASFPKSGNTWMRAFIGSLLGFGTITPSGAFSSFTSSCSSVDVRRHVHGSGPMPEADDGFAWREQTQALLSQAVGQGRHFVKSHSRYGTVAGNRLVNADVSLLAVVIVRNPFDVAVSFANYLTTTPERALKAMANPKLAFSSNDNPVQYRLLTGSWDIHAASWLGQTELPVLLVRYEDLFFSPADTFALVASRVLGIDDPARIGAAIAEAGFDRLAAAEQQNGFVENISTVNRFFNKGYPWHSLEVLSDAEKQMIWGNHRLVAEALGYRWDGRAISLAKPDLSALADLSGRWKGFIHTG